LHDIKGCLRLEANNGGNTIETLFLWCTARYKCWSSPTCESVISGFLTMQPQLPCVTNSERFLSLIECSSCGMEGMLPIRRVFIKMTVTNCKEGECTLVPLRQVCPLFSRRLYNCINQSPTSGSNCSLQTDQSHVYIRAVSYFLWTGALQCRQEPVAILGGVEMVDLNVLPYR